MKRRILALTLGMAVLAGTLSGCGEKNTEVAGTAQRGTEQEQSTQTMGAGEELSGELVFAVWDNNLMDYMDANDMVGKFQEKYRMPALK